MYVGSPWIVPEFPDIQDSGLCNVDLSRDQGEEGDKVKLSRWLMG